MNQVAIIDYGMGNLNSLKNKLVRLNVNSIVSSKPNEISNSDRIVLPGVGHFGRAMESLRKLNLIDILNEEVLIKKKPVLGICLGMQLMASKSEEGGVNGLSWIKGEVVKFDVKDCLKYKIPHVSWNNIEILKKSNLMRNIDSLSEFYFSHSYYFKPFDSKTILSKTVYESQFVSAIEQGNIYGVQYHPETSYEAGDQLFKNFLDL